MTNFRKTFDTVVLQMMLQSALDLTLQQMIMKNTTTTIIITITTFIKTVMIFINRKICPAKNLQRPDLSSRKRQQNPLRLDCFAPTVSKTLQSTSMTDPAPSAPPNFPPPPTPRPPPLRPPSWRTATSRILPRRRRSLT